MGPGIRTTVRKAIRSAGHTIMRSAGREQVFPRTPDGKRVIEARLSQLEADLEARRVPSGLGTLHTLPHPAASAVYKRFIDHNPGNLGSWSDDADTTHATGKFEHDVIHAMIDLYRANHRSVGGHITSGGTEGNLFAVWLGRSNLERQCKYGSVCLVRTGLTHYSVPKAATVSGIPELTAPLSRSHWNMDPEGFVRTLEEGYRRGYRGFIVACTEGYTVTGTSDDAEALMRAAAGFRTAHADARFFFWTDAAFNGLVTPFLRPSYTPFAGADMSAYVVDFHKFGMVPYPAGIVLYRNGLRKAVERPIEYLPETDATLSGSRSALPAVSIWTMMHSLGREGYRSLALEQLANKTYLMRELGRRNVRIVTDPHSLTCGMQFPGGRLPKTLEDTYSLYPARMSLRFSDGSREKVTMYKFYFLPHCTRSLIRSFLREYDASA